MNTTQIGYAIDNDGDVAYYYKGFWTLFFGATFDADRARNVLTGDGLSRDPTESGLIRNSGLSEKDLTFVDVEVPEDFPEKIIHVGYVENDKVFYFYYEGLAYGFLSGKSEEDIERIATQIVTRDPRYPYVGVSPEVPANEYGLVGPEKYVAIDLKGL